MRKDIIIEQLIEKTLTDLMKIDTPINETIEKSWRVLQFELSNIGKTKEDWIMFCHCYMTETLINTFDTEFSEEEMRKLKCLHPELKDL